MGHGNPGEAGTPSESRATRLPLAPNERESVERMKIGSYLATCQVRIRITSVFSCFHAATTREASLWTHMGCIYTFPFASIFTCISTFLLHGICLSCSILRTYDIINNLSSLEYSIEPLMPPIKCTRYDCAQGFGDRDEAQLETYAGVV